MKKRKSIRMSDFKRWLKRRADFGFGCGSDDCPLHEWLHRDVSLDDLDEMPPWCARFTGWWDAKSHDAWNNLTGRDALAYLEDAF